LKATRPTAVNLAWAVDRMGRALDESISLDAAELFRRMRAEAIAIYTEDLAANRARPFRRRTHRRPGYGVDALQRRRAGDGGIRDGARGGAGRARRGQKDPGVRRRD